MTSAARFSLSQTPYGPVRRMARIYQRHPNSVDCFLSHSALCINIDEVPQVDDALTRYRRAHELSAVPRPGESTPLVLPVGEARRALTRAALHKIVKEVFAGAATRLRAGGESNAERASRLEQASAHWLRHSAGSHMADKQVDLRLVRDNLGHASLTTTSRYLHIDDERRHRETEEKHRIEWR
jgi:integrase/recombinase XerD